LTNLSVTGNTYAGNTSLGNLAVNYDTVLYGNLTVYGNTTTINSNTVVTNDLLLVLGNNQNSGLALNGAGLAVGNNSLATWRFNNATNSWQSNIAIMPTGNAVLSLGGTNNYWGTAYINTISAYGNVTGNYFVGKGISINGNIAATGFVSVTGNIIADPSNYFVGNGSLLTGIVTYTNANVAAYLPTYTGNITANNISAGGNITGGNILTNNISAGGNITGGNILTNGCVSAAGNIIGNYLLGNGTYLTGTTYYTNANVAAYLPTYAGNLSAGNVVTTGSVSAAGNITGPAFHTANFAIFQSGTKLYIQYNGVNILSIDSTGNITSAQNVTAYGTP
jgi:hypothetical protein